MRPDPDRTLQLSLRGRALLRSSRDPSSGPSPSSWFNPPCSPFELAALLSEHHLLKEEDHV